MHDSTRVRFVVVVDLIVDDDEILNLRVGFQPLDHAFSPGKPDLFSYFIRNEVIECHTRHAGDRLQPLCVAIDRPGRHEDESSAGEPLDFVDDSYGNDVQLPRIASSSIRSSARHEHITVVIDHSVHVQ